MRIPDVVTTERLRLALISPEEAADMKAGRRRPEWHAEFPREDDIDGASAVQAGDVWGSRTIVSGATVLGTIGFFGPPDLVDGVPETEVGYGLVEEARGRGLATEALRGLLAETDRLGVRLRASVEPENEASRRVLAKCDFTQLRGSDEEGNIVMARPLPTAGGSPRR